MASEITLTGGVKMAKGSLAIERRINSQSVDMSGTAFYWNVQSIGLTDEAISIGADIATYGIAWFRNTDATNYVQIGVKSGSTFIPFMRLNAGEFAMLRLEPAVALYAAASATSGVALEFLVVDN